jgi:hypothetical protein
MMAYLEQNHFDDVYKGPGDNFFGSLDASRPEIYPIYWSQSQMQARQSDEMAAVQSFLNRLWRFESEGTTWFDPDVSVIYPDRIRRRPPGTTSKGLGAHTDSGALERWLLPAYQRVFANVFNGKLDEYDPWDAAHRTEVEEYTVENTTKCSVFRTFQGWTALSDMIPARGCCMSCRSRKRWPIFCYAHCWMMCRKMSCAVWLRVRCYPFRRNGTRC